MNITELDSYNLADAVKFNDQLNPRLWDQSEHLLPEVRERLLEIADDFGEFLGVTDLAIKDITISGSNAAYTYTPNSDIDLHLVVDMPDNPVYRELFDAKKFQYNEQHNIRIGGVDVELYVQDADKPHVSQGIYSLLNNDWAQVPRRVKSVVDDTSTRDKFEKVGRQIESAVKSGNLKRITGLAEKIKKMRQTGLENYGEFGPENLAFKMLRSQGLIKQLYDARNRARDQELSLAEQQPQQPFVYGFKKVQEASSPNGVSPETKMFLSEEPPADDEAVLKDFVNFCATALKLEQIPAIKLRRDPEWSVRNRTFGRYRDDQHMLEVAWGNRHIMDVLRTVAHELTHTRQHERDGDRMGPDAGETGSPYENEANARAGVLMRDYGRQHPELFEAGQQGVAEGNLDEGLRSRTAAAAVVAALLGQPIEAMAQSIQGILGFIRDAGTVAQQAKNITRAGLNAEVQQEIVNYVRGVGGDAGSQNLSQLYQLQQQLQQQQPPLMPDPDLREPQNEGASGYIPTKRQARDPRYSMALTVDIRPGEIGRQANKLRLKTNPQGQPQIARANGLVEALTVELAKFKADPMHNANKQSKDQQLHEVAMSPGALAKWAKSDAAQGIRAGFEAELIFSDTNNDDDDDPDLEPDYTQDQPAESVDDIIDFFRSGDYGYMSSREEQLVRADLEQRYLDWADERMRAAFRDEAEDLIRQAIEDADWDQADEIENQLTLAQVPEDEFDAVIRAGKQAPRFDSAKEQQDYKQANPLYTKYLAAFVNANDLLDAMVDDSVREQDQYYDAAFNNFSDDFQIDDDSDFFPDIGLTYMSDVANEFNLDWPYMQESGGGDNGGTRDWDDIGNSLADTLGVPVKVSRGYHRTDRDLTSWIVEPDSSLSADNSEDMGLEIISPPMPLDECLTKLQEFFAWAISEGVYANKSTGFHMGVSLPFSGGDVDYTKLALFLGDQYVLEQFGRQANKYTVSAMAKIRQRLGSDSTNVQDALELMRNNLLELANRVVTSNTGFGKFVSINPKGNYIEFRSAGGVDYFEDIDKLKNTLLRYARAMSIAGNPAAEREEYYKKLYKLVSPSLQDPAMALFSQYASGTITAQQLKSQWAELALNKSAPNKEQEREWEAVDPITGAVLATTKNWSGTNATNHFRDLMGSRSFQVREKSPSNPSTPLWVVYNVKTGATMEIVPGKTRGEAADAVFDKYLQLGIGINLRPYQDPDTMTPRTKLAQRIQISKSKDDQQDSENLQARIDADTRNVLNNYVFYRAETGQVIDTVDDINPMQADAVRADIVRRYGHPDESVRMRIE